MPRHYTLPYRSPRARRHFIQRHLLPRAAKARQAAVHSPADGAHLPVPPPLPGLGLLGRGLPS